MSRVADIVAVAGLLAKIQLWRQRQDRSVDRSPFTGGKSGPGVRAPTRWKRLRVVVIRSLSEPNRV